MQHRCVVFRENQEPTPCSRYQETEGKTILIARRYTETDVRAIRKTADSLNNHAKLFYQEYADMIQERIDKNASTVALVTSTKKDNETVQCLSSSFHPGPLFLHSCGLENEKSASISEITLIPPKKIGLF